MIKTFGYLGLFVIVFAESGLLIGFVLPGDSLLFTAGLLASQNYLDITILLPVLFIAAILGDNTGYFFGKKVGPKIFKREDSVIFHKDNLVRAEKFYEKYGPFTLIVARYIPIVRTFAPLVAGVGKMEYKRFFIYNIIGNFFWVISMTLAGFYLVKVFPGLEDRLSLVVGLIIVASFILPVYHYIKEKRSKK